MALLSSRRSTRSRRGRVGPFFVTHACTLGGLCPVVAVVTHTVLALLCAQLLLRVECQAHQRQGRQGWRVDGVFVDGGDGRGGVVDRQRGEGEGLGVALVDLRGGGGHHGRDNGGLPSAAPRVHDQRVLRNATRRRGVGRRGRGGEHPASGGWHEWVHLGDEVGEVGGHDGDGIVRNARELKGLRAVPHGLPEAEVLLDGGGAHGECGEELRHELKRRHGGEVEESDLVLCDGPIVRVEAHGEVELSLPLALSEELVEHPRPPDVVPVAWFGRVGDVGSVDEHLAHEGVLLAAPLLQGRAAQRQNALEVPDELHVAAHVRGEDHVNHHLAKLSLLLDSEVGDEVTVAAGQEGPGHGAVVVFEHALVIV
mmetsp:Transcript_2008/g.5549  ORF Transcript_2008/g.5549 Transcript_2008/m.5549 type:complete len:368 (-) Transcript_2008:149-1252(-)